jgi:formate hydrogenlyase subunit 3/multisubunit Na+/H+ antiporter MnhD subunit
MTDITLAVALPLLGAFLLPIAGRGGLAWLGGLLGPGLLVLCALIVLANLSAFEAPYAIALGGFAAPVGITFYIDLLALVFALAVPLVTLLLWPGDDAEAGIRRQSLTLLLAAALTGLALSGDLFNLYVFYELAAVASYGLVAGHGSSAGYVAAFRYLMISALGSVFGLLGIALIYFNTGTLNLAHLDTLGDQLANPQGLAAFALLVIGFGVKAELFPVNGWVPEVYAAADRRVAALLAGLASKLAVLAIVRIALLVFPHEEARQLLLLLGVLGVVIGELAAWQARDVARMLAWSSVGQLGVVFVAFSLPGTAGLIAGVTAALHHLVIKSALFLIADRWGGAVSRLRGAAATSRLGAGLFVLFALSLLGLPPLPGFWSKFLVLTGLAEAGNALHLVALAVILTGTVLEGGYLMRVIAALYGRADGASEVPRLRRSNLFASALFAIVLLAAAVLIDPLWQGLNTLAVAGADVTGYVETVLQTGAVR